MEVILIIETNYKNIKCIRLQNTSLFINISQIFRLRIFGELLWWIEEVFHFAEK